MNLKKDIKKIKYYGGYMATEFTGLYVKVENRNLEGALKKLKRKIKDYNLMLEIKEKMYYIKPSEKKRTRKHNALRRNQQKNQDF